MAVRGSKGLWLVLWSGIFCALFCFAAALCVALSGRIGCQILLLCVRAVAVHVFGLMYAAFDQAKGRIGVLRLA